MNGNEFQQFVVNKLLDIENRITSLEQKLTGYEKLTKILVAVASILAAKVGVDLSGVV